MKIRPVGTKLFHEDGPIDGQTDMTTLIVAFTNFATAPKNDIQPYFWSPLLFKGVVSPKLSMKQISRL